MISELRARLEANLEAARVAMEAAQAEPWVEGSTGQLRPHPGYAVAAQCDATAAKLAMELRLVGALEASPEEWDPFAELAARRDIAGSSGTRS